MNVLEAAQLGKRHGRIWALRDCNLSIPGGSVVALVGPNGAGKSTFLHLTVGLTKPTTGYITVLNGNTAGSPTALDGIGFVAQDAPLYKSFSVRDTLRFCQHMNSSWDQAMAVTRLARLDIPLKRKVGKLSGGQQSQLALTVALARRPRLLILDEPAARLDPLARHDFMGSLMESVSEDGIAVILSSHVVSDLERIADYLIVINRGTVQLAGPTEQLLDDHALVTGPGASAAQYASVFKPIYTNTTKGCVSMLVHSPPGAATPSGWQSHAVGLEELVLAYLRQPPYGAENGRECGIRQRIRG